MKLTKAFLQRMQQQLARNGAKPILIKGVPRFVAFVDPTLSKKERSRIIRLLTKD